VSNALKWSLAVWIALSFTACGGPVEETPPAGEQAPVAEKVPTPKEAPAPAPPTAAEPEVPAGALTAEGKIVWRPDLWKNPPRGLSPVPDPVGNRTTVEKVELGRLLYFDKRLSKDGTISCASCHHPKLGFSNGQRFGVGIGGQLGTRNSPTVYNAAYNNEQFWDGRAKSLEEQALGPITNPVEMGNTTPELLRTLNQIPEYVEAFQKVFNQPKITEWEVQRAIAAFERTILTGDAPYDRYKAGVQDALSPEALRGLAIFEGKGGCVVCHLGPNFSDNQFHNLGVGTEAKEPDIGRMALTKRETDWARFKTPTLRNVAVTGPYMHDGSLKTLEEVVAVYEKGGVANKNLDPLIRPIALTAEEKADLVAFLKEGLTRELEVPEPTYPPAPIAQGARAAAPAGEGEGAPPEASGEGAPAAAPAGEDQGAPPAPNGEAAP
jgi:cytochrome c peroxidase